MKNNYGRFFAMVLTATVIMFGFMYINVYELNHIFFSETRMYKAIMMGSIMSIVMLLFMWKMYTNKKVNTIILVTSAIVFGLSVFLIRSQTTIQDVAWMRAMIPHHSIAILNSERAELSDPRVNQLAEEIIQSQEDEISRMKELIEELENE